MKTHSFTQTSIHPKSRIVCVPSVHHTVLLWTPKNYLRVKDDTRILSTAKTKKNVLIILLIELIIGSVETRYGARVMSLTFFLFWQTQELF
jgi:hypothetical protein